MADSEDIFLRAKHRTFSGLTEGSRPSLASLLAPPVSPLTVRGNVSANLDATQVVATSTCAYVATERTQSLCSFCVALFLQQTGSLSSTFARLNSS